MFTGIITALGTISQIDDNSNKYIINILDKYPDFLANINNKTKTGDSIAVNGVCLTIVEFDHNYFIVDILDETLAKTNLKDISNNKNINNIINIVNLEHALRLGDSLDGHMVSGHVDTVISVENIITNNNDTNDTNDTIITFKVDQSFFKYIAYKGSVSINGVSLTVSSIKKTISKNLFTVNLIPHTLDNTNLQYLQIGSKVNLEVDTLARYSINYLENYLNNK